MDIKITDKQLSTFLKRRFSIDELNELIFSVNHKIEDEGIMKEMAIYDVIRNFIASKNNSDINDEGTEQEYWDSYVRYEKPLVSFVKSQLDL